MSLKRTTIIFVGGVALAAWFSAAMTPGRAPAASADIRPAPIDARGAMLSGEIARLRERLRPDAAPRKASRNPFVFRSSPSSSSLSSKSRAESGSSGGTAGAVAPSAKDASAALLDGPRLRLSLAGVAEDPDPAGGAPVRTAIIAANGQVFLVKEGGMVTDRGVEDVQYQVRTISADSAELVDPRDNTVHRLALK
jgi:hypothetical protein